VKTVSNAPPVAAPADGLPTVALAGRPNVGKSTLFNRIVGARKAITDARPGSTRDRNALPASWCGVPFELVDTGGLLLASEDPLLGPASAQAERAIAGADVVVLVVDGRAGRLPDDEAIARRLHALGRSVVLAVNKCEDPSDSALAEFAALGFPAAFAVSAEHGTGVGELLDEVATRLPAREDEAAEPGAAARVALVGRPNVGKSSLLNRFLGEERTIVSPLAGTTRDAVDARLRREGREYVLVDTAGIRRARLLRERVDQVSVHQAHQAILRADVAVVVLDAADQWRELDATIAGYAKEAGRAVVLALNKWDLAVERFRSQAEAARSVREFLKFVSHAPVVPVSALTGQGLGGLWRAIEAAHAASRRRVATGPLNRVLAEATRRFPPKAARGTAELRILFASQVGTRPPTFALFLNRAVGLHFSYERYLENRLREAFDFAGTPIVLATRVRRRVGRRRPSPGLTTARGHS
jgi:GTP-binding protein